MSAAQATVDSASEDARSRRAESISAWLAPRRDEMLDLVVRLAACESPSHDLESQHPAFALVAQALAPTGLVCRHLPGKTSAGQLIARPPRLDPARARGYQLLLGHVDTVWPIGTLATMPIRAEGGRLYGPGVFDMKAGLAIAVFALAALRALDLAPPLAPVVFFNSDEELGSPDSERRIDALARRAARALVLEPAFGDDGRLKTERKGVGRFELRFRGRPAHAGLAPETGASAIRELARATERLFALGDLHAAARGASVNVGVVSGGTRANVVAGEARAVIDVRFRDQGTGAEIERAIRTLEPTIPGVAVEASGRIERAPLERTARNRALYGRAVACGGALGLTVGEASVGGGSDGSLASRWTATLDGLGAVGGGAHADDEHIVVASLPERAALLALLLLEPRAD